MAIVAFLPHVLKLVCFSAVVLQSVVKGTGLDNPAYTRQHARNAHLELTDINTSTSPKGGSVAMVPAASSYLSLLQLDSTSFSITDTYPNVTPLDAFIAARQVTTGTPSPTVNTPTPDPDYDACTYSTALASSCASATPGFDSEPFEKQISCLCYDGEGEWAGQDFDDPYTSCLSYYYTAMPSSWYSVVIYTDDYGNAQPTPCEYASSLLSSASVAPTSTTQPATNSTPSTTVRRSKYTSVHSRPLPTSHVSAPKSTVRPKSEAAMSLGYLHGYEVLPKVRPAQHIIAP